MKTTFVRTLTTSETDSLLRITYEHRNGLRDHTIIVLALKTGLREHEILALNVGDVINSDGTVKRWLRLSVFKRSNLDVSMQQVALNAFCRDRLQRLIAAKKADGHPVDTAAPLFISREKTRLSARQLRTIFKVWQQRAGFERAFNFHTLRHTACTDLYRLKRDSVLVQRFARHKSPSSTAIYTHATDTDLAKAVENL